MGWLWASGPVQEEGRRREPRASGTSESSASAQVARPSADDLDPEIAKFLEMIQAEIAGNKKQPDQTPQAEVPSAPSKTPPPKALSWLTLSPSSQPASTDGPNPQAATERADGAQRTQPRSHATDSSTGQELSLSDSLLPTTMSCRQAFDQAFYCRSPGGQFNAIYRYGSMRSCRDNWADFWFCMKTRSAAGPLREEKIREWHRQKEEKKYGAGKPSSEDVWQARTERLPKGEAFSEPFDPPQVEDREWNEQEIERREEVRRKLGFAR